MLNLNIHICDDDENMSKNLRKLLQKWSSTCPIALNITEYQSAEAFLFNYPENKCDLLLLDIEMRKMNGMELAKSLRKCSDSLPIIFITGFSDYMVEGYDVSALHYLLKPLDENKLFEVLDKFLSKFSTKTNESIIVNVNGEKKKVSSENIYYCEAFGKFSNIYDGHNKEIIAEINISKLADILNSNFIFCHRSYLVNLTFISRISRGEISLDNGRIIPVSRRLYKEVNEKFIEYYRGGKHGRF